MPRTPLFEATRCARTLSPSLWGVSASVALFLWLVVAALVELHLPT